MDILSNNNDYQLGLLSDNKYHLNFTFNTDFDLQNTWNNTPFKANELLKEWSGR